MTMMMTMSTAIAAFLDIKNVYTYIYVCMCVCISISLCTGKLIAALHPRLFKRGKK